MTPSSMPTQEHETMSASTSGNLTTGDQSVPLLPCPFCGSPAEESVYGLVDCTGERGCASGTLSAEQWNRRASPARTPAGEAEKAADELEAVCNTVANDGLGFTLLLKKARESVAALRRAQPPQQTGGIDAEQLATHVERSKPAIARLRATLESRQQPTGDAEELVERLDALYAKATKGPWIRRDPPPGLDGHPFIQAPREKPEHGYDIEVLADDDAIYSTREQDVDLIVALHGAWPALRSAISRIAELREAAKGQLVVVNAANARAAEVAADRDALVFCVMRGSHREARDMARPRFVELNPDERNQAERLSKDADLLARAEAAEACVAELKKALGPLAMLGGNKDSVCAAYYDLPSDTVIYENSGKVITAGDVRRARAALSTVAGEEKL